jgi:outer membrane receptor protein involved in Fe transport
MKYLFLTFLWMSTLALQAQMPAGANRGAGAAQSMTGRMYGKLVDAKTGKGIDAASVQMIQSKFDTVSRTRKDVVIAGMLTSRTGEFALEGLPLYGNMKLKITAIGYKTIDQKAAFEAKPGGDMSQMLAAMDKDLGNLKMEADAQTLENVTVTASKPTMTMAIDRKIFNVEKNLTSVGGTAVDVMRNVPSLQVDIDGNVSLRNSSPTIFVDGRPTTLTLDQIPAETIASVEVITNPSAKYDASGGNAGILNIVLKKNRKAGYNGNLRAGIDSRARANLGADINVRQGKVNVFASANLRQFKSISDGETERSTFQGNPNSYLFQKDRTISEGMFGFGRFGVDYFIDNRNTLSLSGNVGRGNFESNNTSNIKTDSLYSNGVVSTITDRISESESNFKNLGLTLGYKRNFTKPGRELTADINFNARSNESINYLTTDIFKGSTQIGALRQRIDGGGDNQFVTIQTDYVTPVSAKVKLEGGLRAQIRHFDNLQDFFIQAPGSNDFVKQPRVSSVYSYTDRVYAAYGNVSGKEKKLGYQFGLRVESSDYDGTLKTVNESNKDTTVTYGNSFPISLFPSIFLSYKLTETSDLQFNYSRRVNRPNFFQVNPFTDYSDLLNLRRGNPDLTPEFTNSIELSYSKTMKNNSSFLASLYFKNTNDLITSIQIKDSLIIQDSLRSVLVNTFTNANASYIGGLELTYRTNLKKWWEMSANLNLFTSKIDITDPSAVEQDLFASWFLKVNNTFKLPKNFTVQLSGDYTSKTVLPPNSGGGGGGRGGGMGGFFGAPASTAQGYIRPNYGVDIAIRYEFLKNKAGSLSLNVNDIFRTRVTDVYSESTFFVQNSWRRRDPQIFRLNFSYRFGKMDMQLFKRKNMRGERESMMNMGDGM